MEYYRTQKRTPKGDGQRWTTAWVGSPLKATPEVSAENDQESFKERKVETASQQRGRGTAWVQMWHRKAGTCLQDAHCGWRRRHAAGRGVGERGRAQQSQGGVCSATEGSAAQAVRQRPVGESYGATSGTLTACDPTFLPCSQHTRWADSQSWRAGDPVRATGTQARQPDGVGGMQGIVSRGTSQGGRLNFLQILKKGSERTMVEACGPRYGDFSAASGCPGAWRSWGHG